MTDLMQDMTREQAQAMAMLALAAMPVSVSTEVLALEGGEDPAFGAVK